jgi:cystathionine beta-synthase
MTRRLAREDGLLVGGSCGMAVVGALRDAASLPPDEAKDAVIVVLLPDGGRGYLSKIFSDRWMASYGFLTQDGGSTVGDILRGKSGELPDLVHTHPSETVRDAIEILRTYHVSQMPVVNAEPPIMAGEVAGSVTERDLLDLVFTGKAQLADRVGAHMAPPLPLVGAGEPVDVARQTLEQADAVMVVEDGKPAGVLTRHDLLGFITD